MSVNEHFDAPRTSRSGPEAFSVDAADRLLALVAELPHADTWPARDPVRLVGAGAGLARTLEAIEEPAGPEPADLHAALAQFGAEQAAAGFEPTDLLDQVTAAVASLEEGRRQALDLTELHRVALEAWAEESGRLARLDQCLDAYTGLHTEAYLRTQVGQLYERCDALAIRPDSMCALLTVTFSTAGHEPLSWLSAAQAAIGHLRREFAAGETVVAVDRATFVALVPVHTVADASVSLQAAFTVDAALDAFTWQVTASPLGPSSSAVLARLDELHR